MNIFDKEIDDVENIIETLEYKKFPVSKTLENVKNNMIFSNESAFELGGGFNHSLSFELITSSNRINQDEIILIGDDIPSIKEDCDFIRITLLNIKDEKLEGQNLYNAIEKIKLTKYRVSPLGYMLRKATNNSETVRVSKKFKQEHNFQDLGSSYIHAYKMIPSVNYVKEIFITGNCPSYNKLKEIGNQKKEITDALDHILKGMVLNDCGSCSVKELCDKVEGLRQIHQQNRQKDI